ncbi:LGFP repeat-containing protein [Corynebacterium cystitidis]|nr:LGFP repeat-containing protein [Corynebacterium cystitidis]
MRSDREEIPGDFTKEEADLAETKEAQLQEEDNPTLNSAPGCKVYWPSPFEVCGAIRELYDSMGGPKSFLTFPKSNELTNPDGVGKRSEFVNGFIYWHPKTGAHTVSVPATVVWAKHGWERGHFGYPMTNDIALGDSWYKQKYQGGYIYTRNSIPAVQAGIQGRIYDKWQDMGAEKSTLGFPISSEEKTPDGIGRYNLFQKGIMVWHPKFGAHAITGDVLLQWVYAEAIGEGQGYPTGDPQDFQEGWKQQPFEKGKIYGFQLEKFFPEYLPGAGLEQDTPTLQGSGIAGGNDYTDELLLETRDMCGKPILLRRGWFNTTDKAPWGYDKIVYKHNIWSLWSIKTVLNNSCIREPQGPSMRYEEMVYQVKCSDPVGAVCQLTGKSFAYRAIVEPKPRGNASEPRGITTMYPIHNTGTHGMSDKAPSWFSTDIPTLDLWKWQ